MKIAAIILSFALIASAANASTKIELFSSCDAFLAQESVEIDLNDSVRAYVQLVEHYLKKQSEADAKLLIDQITNSESPINPLSQKTDTFSLQVAGALDQVLAKISPQDWLQIKEQILGVEKADSAVRVDRTEKKKDTEWVMDPKLLDELTIVRIKGAPVWHQVGDRFFVATATLDDQSIHLYEFIDGKLKESGKPQVTGSWNQASPSWHTVGARTFLAVGSDDKRLYIYELINGELKLAEDPFSFEGGIRITPAWIDVSGRTYIAITSWDGEVQLFALEGERFKKKGSPMRLKGGMKSSPKWHVDADGRVYLAAGSNNASLYIFELVNGELKKPQDLDLKQGEIAGSPEWHVAPDGVYVSVIPQGNQLNIFKLFHGTFMQSGGRVDARASSSPAWLTLNQKTFVAVASQKNGIDFYALREGKLSRIDYYPTHGAVADAPSWFIDEVNGRAFLAVSANDGYLHVYELVGDALVERSKTRVGRGGLVTVSTTPAWQVIPGKGVFIVVGFNEGVLSLVQVMGPAK